MRWLRLGSRVFPAGRFSHQIVRLGSRFFPAGRFFHQIARLGSRFLSTGRFPHQIARLESWFFPTGRSSHQIARLGSRFLSTGRSFHLMVPPYIRFFWSSSKIIPLPLPPSQYAEIVYDSRAPAPCAAQKTRPSGKTKKEPSAPFAVICISCFPQVR